MEKEKQAQTAELTKEQAEAREIPTTWEEKYKELELQHQYLQQQYTELVNGFNRLLLEYNALHLASLVPTLADKK